MNIDRYRGKNVSFIRQTVWPVERTYSGADKLPLPSNAPPKQAATLEQKHSLQAL